MRDVIAQATGGTPCSASATGFRCSCNIGPLAGRAHAQRVATVRSGSGGFLKVENEVDTYTHCSRKHQVIRMPVAHGDGSFFADEATLDRLQGEGQVVFRYCGRGRAGCARGEPQRSPAQHRRHLRPNGARARPHAASRAPCTSWRSAARTGGACWRACSSRSLPQWCKRLRRRTSRRPRNTEGAGRSPLPRS